MLKTVLRLAGLAPAVGIAPDAAAGAITLAQRAKAKDPERKKELNRELAGDAAAMIPVVGQGTRGAQATHKAAKVVREARKNKLAEAAAKQDEVSEAFSFYRRLGKTIYENAGLPTGPIAKHYTGVKRKNIGDGKVRSDVNKAVKKIERKIGTKVGPGADTPTLVAQAQKKNRARNRNRKLGLGPENPNDRNADFRADKERKRAPGDR